MTSTLISNSTIKIFLTNEDMKDYNIKFDDLDKESHETKLFLFRLIDEVKENNDIDLSGEKLYIEAFEQANGCCLIYISIRGEKFKKKEKLSTDLIYEFRTLSDAISASSALWNNQCHLFRESEFLCSENNYRLIIKAYSRAEKRLCNCLCEYGCEIGDDEISASVTREHYTMLIDKNAVEMLSLLN